MSVMASRYSLVGVSERFCDDRHRHTRNSKPRAVSSAKIVERRSRLNFAFGTGPLQRSSLLRSGPTPSIRPGKDKLVPQLGRR